MEAAAAAEAAAEREVAATERATCPHPDTHPDIYPSAAMYLECKTQVDSAKSGKKAKRESNIVIPSKDELLLLCQCYTRKEGFCLDHFLGKCENRAHCNQGEHVAGRLLSRSLLDVLLNKHCARMREVAIYLKRKGNLQE